MERRREPRIECRETVRIEVLGANAKSCSGLLVNLSGQGAKLTLSEPLPVNTMLRIDAASAVYLGDVCYCSEQEGFWHVGVKLAHSVRANPGLRNLAERLNQEAAAVKRQQQNP